MNRRNFFSTLMKAAAGATVAYSFPSIIVPKNIITPTLAEVGFFGLDGKVSRFTWFGTPLIEVIPDGLFMAENTVYFMRPIL
jgi:hypothetical protein